MNAGAIRLGIVGTGRIARRFIEEACAVSGIRVVAAYNPCRSSAERFISNLPDNIPTLTAAQSYESLIDAVDAVYISSPTETHVHYAQQALEAGAHVLCEKPSSFQRHEIMRLYATAREKNVVFLHAVKTAFFPAFGHLEEVVRSGVICDVVSVEASFTKLMSGDVPELAAGGTGGSMRWLSTYPLYAISRFLGTHLRDAQFFSLYDERDVEVFTDGFLRFPHASASFKVGFGAKTDGSLVLTGSNGYVRVPAPWWNTSRYEVHFERPDDIVLYQAPIEGSGLRYEIQAFAEMIKGGDIRSSRVTEDNDLFFADVYARFVAGQEGLHCAL